MTEGSADGSGEHDTRESEEDARMGLLLLQLLFRRYESLTRRADSLEDIRPGSELSEDHDAAPYHSVPDQILQLVGTGLDHLNAVQMTVEDSDGDILAMSLFTLIRSAFESIGTGLWILQPESRDERLLRSRRLSFEGRSLLNLIAADLGKPDPGLERVRLKLTAQFQQREGLVGRSLTKRYTVTERLKSIAPMVPGLVYPPVTMWRMASGIAHGNQHIMNLVLERQQLTEYDATGSASFAVTSSVKAVAMFYENALQMTEALLDLHDRRNSG